MKAPKVLAVASALDLDFRYGCTPAWWQLWKGLYEAGIDVVVTPYRGPAVQSPWWRAYDNPCRYEGEAFAAARLLKARARGARLVRRREGTPPDTQGDQLVRRMIWHWVTPRWKRHLSRIVEAERPDAVVVFGVPVSHFRGIPTMLRERYSMPVAYFDGDVPMSFPEYGGMDTGFNIYHGADVGEYDLVLSNSEGGLGRLVDLGAKRAEAVFWGADPALFSPVAVEKELDVFFYGYGDKFRGDAIEMLVAAPSRRLTEVRFAVGGDDFRGNTGLARGLGWIPFSSFNRAISASRINLNITRRPHATTPFSSTARPFELAAAGATIVSGPHLGIERWFDPQSEMVLVSTAEEAIDAYETLLADPHEASLLGRRARERVLDEHTFVHRARRLAELLGLADGEREIVTSNA
jgi:hypothetical protein